jgi:hypothetical protein
MSLQLRFTGQRFARASADDRHYTLSDHPGFRYGKRIDIEASFFVTDRSGARHCLHSDEFDLRSAPVCLRHVKVCESSFSGESPYSRSA